MWSFFKAVNPLIPPNLGDQNEETDALVKCFLGCIWKVYMESVYGLPSYRVPLHTKDIKQPAANGFIGSVIVFFR